MNGVLNIDKPAGMTSHDVVGRVRRLARLKRVGHAGTLDPDATGVLLVCLGPATRIAEYLADASKSYRATLALGRTTTTEDASGDTLAEIDASEITENLLRETLPRFVGDILQVPPMVSAIHHEGKRLYELARQGITVERDARPVHIDGIRLMDFTPGPLGQATLDVDCGKGTYIRTLCADIGIMLGVGTHGDPPAHKNRRVLGHRRDAVGATDRENIAAHLMSPSAVLADLPRQVTLGAEDEDAIGHGRALPTGLPSGTVARIVTPNDQLIALGISQDGLLHPFKVFV